MTCSLDHLTRINGNVCFILLYSFLGHLLPCPYTTNYFTPAKMHAAWKPLPYTIMGQPTEVSTSALSQTSRVSHLLYSCYEKFSLHRSQLIPFHFRCVILFSSTKASFGITGSSLRLLYTFCIKGCILFLILYGYTLILLLLKACKIPLQYTAFLVTNIQQTGFIPFKSSYILYHNINPPPLHNYIH